MTGPLITFMSMEIGGTIMLEEDLGCLTRTFHRTAWNLAETPITYWDQM